jgi:hypothetical protein
MQVAGAKGQAAALARRISGEQRSLAIENCQEGDHHGNGKQ